MRSPSAHETCHPLYRTHPERRMQSPLFEDISRIGVLLDPGHVYEQVMAQSAGHHRVLDLLAITKTKRLVLLELKATEDSQLPLLAADYWQRIRTQPRTPF